MCLPRPDSSSVFGALLDRDAGSFRVGPADVAVPAGRRYLPGTMVLETTWMARAGWLVVQDALLVGRWHHDDERSRTHRPAPSDYDAAHVLVRTVRCVHGSVEVQVECEPVFDYGRTPASWSFDGPGYGSAVATAPDSETALRLATDLPLGLEGGRARARLSLREGEQAFAALAWSEHPLPETFEEADERLAGTAQFWRNGSPAGGSPTIPGASTCSGARSRSRVSSSRRPARCSPRRPPPCRRHRPENGTGTTASRGSATRPSGSGASTRSGSTTRRTTSSTSSPTQPRTRPTSR